MVKLIISMIFLSLNIFECLLFRYEFFVKFLLLKTGSSHCGTVETNLTSIHVDVGSIPAITQWVGICHCCFCGCGIGQQL